MNFVFMLLPLSIYVVLIQNSKVAQKSLTFLSIIRWLSEAVNEYRGKAGFPSRILKISRIFPIWYSGLSYLVSSLAAATMRWLLKASLHWSRRTSSARVEISPGQAVAIFSATGQLELPAKACIELRFNWPPQSMH